MKKTIAFILLISLFLQTAITVNAITDSKKNLYTGKIYTHDDKFSGYEIMNGIDISEYQETVDFNKIKQAGTDFVILRAACRGYGSKGTIFTDKKFHENIKKATDLGIDAGAYIYSQAITEKEAIEEADYILNIVKDYKITLPIVFDYEYAPVSTGRLNAAKLTAKQHTNICNAFCKRVESKGYTAMVYANQSMLTNDLIDDDIAKNYDIWLANYSTAPKLSGKMYDCDYTYWQYSSTGKVNGISGNIDCNFRYYKKPLKVNGLKVTSENEKSTAIQWSKVKGCYGYRIYRLNPKTSKYEKIGSTKGAAKTSFIDNNSLGVSNTYKVRAISAYKNTFANGTLSNEVTSKGIFNIALESNKIGSTSISWSKVSDSDSYEVYRSEKENDGYQKIATISDNSFKFTDNFKTFKTMYYKVLSVKNNSVNENRFTPTLKVIQKQPSLTNVSLKTNSKIQITWNNVLGADGTEIWRKADNGVCKLIKTINNNSTNTYIDKNIKKGTKYTYKIRNFVNSSSKNYSNYTSAKNAIPMKTVSAKLTASKKAVTISYAKIYGASGYEIYMKTAGQKYKLIRTTKKLNYTKKGLVSGKKYYFRIRAYKTVNGKKVYASFSKVKNKKPLY